MKNFADIESISDGLNEKAKKERFFEQKPVDIDHQANKFVAQFCSDNGLEAHTVSPSRWWFESKKHGMYEDGEIELHPLVNHAFEEFHPGDKNHEIKFVAVNVEKAKITDDDENNLT